MIKKRELFLLLFVITILGAMLWFFMYYTPAMNEISAMRMNIETRENRLLIAEMQANSRAVQYEVLNNDMAELEQGWLVVSENLPYYFDDADTLRRIQRIISPHTQSITMSLGASVPFGEFGTYITSASINFSTTYGELMQIFNTFAAESVDNRIVNYTIAIRHNSVDVQIEVQFLAMRSGYEHPEANGEGDS